MPSFTHLLALAVIGILLFGRGRISDLMGDVAKGIKSFKKGLHDDDTPTASSGTHDVIEPKKVTAETMTNVTPQPIYKSNVYSGDTPSE